MIEHWVWSFPTLLSAAVLYSMDQMNTLMLCCSCWMLDACVRSIQCNECRFNPHCSIVLKRMTVFTMLITWPLSKKSSVWTTVHWAKVQIFHRKRFKRIFCVMTKLCEYLPDQVSMKLDIESLSIPLGTQLLHSSAGGAEHQLQVCLRGGRSLWASGRWLRVHCPPIETHTAPLSVPLQPVPLPRTKSRLPCHTATTSITLDVALLT